MSAELPYYRWLFSDILRAGLEDYKRSEAYLTFHFMGLRYKHRGHHTAECHACRVTAALCLYWEAADWIEGRRVDESGATFEYCCEALDNDPGRIRRGILALPVVGSRDFPPAGGAAWLKAAMKAKHDGLLDEVK